MRRSEAVIKWKTLAVAVSALLALSACKEVQLNGPVGGAEVSLSPLNNPNTVSWVDVSTSKNEVIRERGQQRWDESRETAKWVWLGNVTVESTVSPNQHYLLTAKYGTDMDADANKVIDSSGSSVAGDWRAIMNAEQLDEMALKVSVLTEAAYQYVKPDINTSSYSQIQSKLDEYARKVIVDLDKDGVVDYLDVLKWSRFFENGTKYLGDIKWLDQLAEGITLGADEGEIARLARQVYENGQVNPPLQRGTDRPAQVQVPSNYTPTARYPLIIVLHGLKVNGALESGYLGLNKRVDTKQFVLVVPDGTANANGDRFWNATPACCAALAAYEDNAGVDYTQIDDVAYIRSLIKEAAATYSIDTSRIGLFGHSNGGFMALRMACEASDLVTAVLSLAGSTFAEAASCAPANYPVSILALHGDADETVLYDGEERLGESYPSATETVGRFAALAGCDSDNATMQENIDVVGSISGAETTVLAYPDCAVGVDVELWTIVGGPHIPLPWLSSAQDSFVDWLIDHPRK